MAWVSLADACDSDAAEEAESRGRESPMAESRDEVTGPLHAMRTYKASIVTILGHDSTPDSLPGKS